MQLRTESEGLAQCCLRKCVSNSPLEGCSWWSAGSASEAVPGLATLPQLSGEAAAAALAAWAAAEEHAEWAPMEWLAADAAPMLVSAIRMVPPADETEALRCVPDTHCVPYMD